MTNADTSEESTKRTKKKHKRVKREPAGSEMSTPSDEISSTAEPLLTTKTIPSTSSTPAPIPDLLSAPSHVEEISTIVSTGEEAPASPSIETTPNIEDEPVATASSKKTAKRRKKKAHTTEEGSEMNSSTTSTTDKDSSSTAATTPVKQTSLESGIKTRLVSDDDKQESEWITPENKKKNPK